MLHFDPVTGLAADPAETVREAVRREWRAALGPTLDVAAETPAGQLIDSQTAAIVQKDSDVLYMAQQFNPLTAEGVWQDALAKIYFLSRKIAQSSVAVCVCTGLPGTVIPAGAVIKSVADGSLWTTDPAGPAVVIPPSGPDSGRVEVSFTSQRREALPAAPGTLTRIVTVTPGWDTVTNPAAAVPGRIEENRAEFEQRRADSVAKNAHGSLSSIYSNLADLPNVIHCVVLENTTNMDVIKWGVTIPGHSIYASLVGGEDAAIAEALYRKKDAGCGTAGNTEVRYQDFDTPGAPVYVYRIERPSAVSLTVAVSLKLGQSITVSNAQTIESAIRTAILDNFYGRDGAVPAGIAQNIYASRFYCPLNAALSGTGQLVSVRIATPATGAGSRNWTDSITVHADQFPVLAAEDIHIYVNDAIPDVGKS